MTATDELRRLLDERGVDHESTEWIDGVTVSWQDSDGTVFCARESLSLGGPTGTLDVYRLTPSQAIDATLGRGTCHAVFEVDAMSEDDRIGEFVCSECGETFGDGRDQVPRYCPNCGRKVVM